MSKPRVLQLLFFLGSFSLIFVFLWCLNDGQSTLFLISEDEITNQLQDQLQSDLRHSCSGHETLSKRTTGSAALKEDLKREESEDVFARSQTPLDLQHTQYARKKLIRSFCNHNCTSGFLKRATLNHIPQDQLANLIVDDRHGIIYCYVPKVACTEWKSIMIFLSESLKVNGVPYKNHSDIPIDQIHGNGAVYLNMFQGNLLKQKIQNYKKFLFVRHPFVRLISAYRDKFEKKNDYFYHLLAVPILKRYRKLVPLVSAEDAHAAGIRPSFSDFIQYILDLPDDDGISFQEHWRQVNYLCHPCQIEYDFVGKMETMNEDARHLLRLLKVDHIVHFPSSTNNRTEESWINTWFAEIPTDWRRKLYKIYESDFKLFGYSLPENFFEN